MSKELERHVAEYKRDGFTIFEGLFSEAQMQKWRQKHQELMTDYNGQTWFGKLG
ncbi:MAG: hypothetical protein O7E52_06215 [Candidatus Poribacteria bacterium]|nr:hypothetical protein [Candidatus Poribacteria bacterium]